MSVLPTPGWYPDPTPPADAPAGLRWWDGSAWTSYAGPAGGRRSTPDGEPLADWWQRLLAYLVDGLIVGIPVAVLTFAWVFLLLGRAMSDGSSNPLLAQSWLVSGVLLVGLLPGLYEALFLRFRGATPGKMLLGIRVRLPDRPGRLPWGTVVIRVLVKTGVPALLRMLPFVGGLPTTFRLLDGLWPLWDRRRQALHDKAAGTVVVRTR